MTQENELKLQAWLDGELSASDAAEVARLASTDREAIALVAELRQLHSRLTDNELPRSVPATPEFYWSQIRRQLKTPAAPATAPGWWERMVGWRRVLIPLATGMAVLAIGVVSLRQTGSLGHGDEVTVASKEMEAVTYKNQSTGMTVIWLQDRGRYVPPVVAQEDPDSDEI